MDKHDEECPRGAAITGQNTLQEAAHAAGLTVKALQKELNLPERIDPQQRLGQLKRQFEFSIHDVRTIVCRP